LLDVKKSPKVEGSNTKAKSAKPIIMIKNIERSLIFDKIAIRFFYFQRAIYDLGFNIATHFKLNNWKLITAFLQKKKIFKYLIF
jgi:hypothetical protein